VFELTGSLTYVMPIMVSILVSKWVSEAIEKQGIYDLVINLNNHPYLDSKRSYLFTSTFADLCTPVSEDTRNIIDVTGGKDIAASALRDKVDWLKGIGARDGGFPIIKRGVLTGYISASELEYALGNSPSIKSLIGRPDWR
jgi:chloride channel 3/4/5